MICSLPQVLAWEPYCMEGVVRSGEAGAEAVAALWQSAASRHRADHITLLPVHQLARHHARGERLRRILDRAVP